MNYKPYLYFKNYNEMGMEQFPIEVIEGRLPHNENEIAISEDIRKQFKGRLRNRGSTHL